MTRSRGFTLIEIAVVLIVMGFILAMVVKMTAGVLEQQRRNLTRDRLSLIDTALANYVSQMRRLPCPADGALSADIAAAGFEVRGVSGDCTNAQVRGVVPWRTIGLSELDATDGFLDRYMYRVAPGLTRDDAMNLTDCDPAGLNGAQGSAPNQTCRSCNGSMSSCTNTLAIVANRGLQVRNSVGGTIIANPSSIPANGAAYIVLSAGENRAGAYGVETGVAQQALTTVGAGEAQNAATAALAAYYVDSTPDFTDSGARFDDILSRPTILTVVAKAGLSPRAH